MSPDTLTPWKEELLWRLYVDTYNRLTYGYADDLIQMDHAGLEVVVAGRPADISESELWAFLDGLPRRYLALFGLATIYRHVRLARDIRPDDVHASLEKHDDIWELSVVTLDKPFLFSNISGRAVLLRHGHPPRPGDDDARPGSSSTCSSSRTSSSSWHRTPPAPRRSTACSRRSCRVRVGRHRPAARQGAQRALPPAPSRCRRSSTSTTSTREKYTVLEIVADDAIGLLYRISRGLSRLGCDLDLALISTEGKKAIDVLHVTKGGNKLSFSDEAAIRQELGRMLEGTDEAD